MLEADQRAALRQALVAAALAVLLAGPALAILALPGLAVHLVSAGLGVVGGMFLAHRTTKTYESSMKASWQRWMRFAVSCETVPEVARKVAGHASLPRAALHASGLALLWVLEVLLLLVALEEGRSAALALPVLLLNGVLAGWLMGRAWVVRGWTRRLRDSVGEMVQSGELGLWGVV